MKEKKTPIHFLKFEELRENPKRCLNDVFKFLLGQEDLSGTVIEKRIDEIVALGHGATQAYKVKTTDKKFNNIDKFTKDQQNYIISNLHDML